MTAVASGQTSSLGPIPPIAVLLLDDNALMGTSLQRWFARSKDFRWAGSFTSPDGIDDALAQLQPDVVLVDWDLPGVDTLALVTRLVHNFPAVRFAMLSGYAQGAAIRACLNAGVRGYLSKDQAPQALASQVSMLAQGRVVISPDIQAVLEVDEPESR